MDANTGKSVKQFIRLISTHYDVAGFILFGSRARSDYRPDSDADIAILLKGNHKEGDFAETKLAMADIAFDVLLDTGVRIQPLPIWEDEWEHPDGYPNPRLLQNIERDGIRL